MHQTALNRAVARATGETVERIQRMGFRLLVMPTVYRPMPSHEEILARIACPPALRQTRLRTPAPQTAA